jgi:hypothetical protein
MILLGWLRQRDRASKHLGSKFIKQAGSDLMDLHPKAESPEQRGLSLFTRLQNWGVHLVPYMVIYYFISHFNL